MYTFFTVGVQDSKVGLQKQHSCVKSQIASPIFLKCQRRFLKLQVLYTSPLSRSSETAICHFAVFNATSGTLTMTPKRNCKCHDAVTSVKVFRDCCSTGMPGMRPACTTMRFKEGREMEKGSSPSQTALSSPSSVNHFADSAYINSGFRLTNGLVLLVAAKPGGYLVCPVLTLNAI